MQIYTLSTVHPELGGVDFDLAVEDDVLPLDWADVPDEFGVEREVGRGDDPGDLPGLPVEAPEGGGTCREEEDGDLSDDRFGSVFRSGSADHRCSSLARSRD